MAQIDIFGIHENIEYGPGPVVGEFHPDARVGIFRFLDVQDEVIALEDPGGDIPFLKGTVPV